MDTHWEKRIAALEKELGEACAAAEGYRLALEEAERQIAEHSRLNICEPAIPKSPSAGSGQALSSAGPAGKDAGPTGEKDLQPKGRKYRG